MPVGAHGELPQRCRVGAVPAARLCRRLRVVPWRPFRAAAPAVAPPALKGASVHDYQREFIELMLQREVLRFGEFTLKSGRISPYFFNLGRLDSGAALAQVGEAYAATAMASELQFDMLFGPAYKGIALAAASGIALAQRYGRDLPWAYNRKEAKNHGEGGTLVGAPLQGRVLIVDDVITAGTA